jgi:tetratricopeptide (TPR) repeat protein
MVMFSSDSRGPLKILRPVDFPDRFRLVAIVSLAGFLCLVPGRAVSQTKPPAPNFAKLSKQADEARDADRLEEAAALYAKALTLQPRWVEGWWSLGTIEYDRDRYLKAALDFEQVIALDPSNGTAHAMLGLCQFELGKDAPALKNLLAAEHLGVTKDVRLRNVALYHMGVLQLRAKKFGDAKETLGHLAVDGVRSKELTTGLGLAALLLTPKEAPPEGTPGAGVIEGAGEAEVLLDSNQFDPAKQKYAQLTSEFPDYPNLHFAFGRLLLETHDSDEAIAEFQRELQRDPKNVNSMLEIAAVRRMTDPQGALHYAVQAAQLAPQLPFAHYLLGLLRFDTGDPAAAIPELEIAQKAFPQEAEVYFSLGNAYGRAGRKAEAAKARAEFARLKAEEAKQPGPNIYGVQVRTLGKENPNQ